MSECHQCQCCLIGRCYTFLVEIWRRRRQLRCEIIHFGITGQKPLLKWMMVEEIDISGR